MGIQIRFVEFDAKGNVRNEVWLLKEHPSSDDDFVAETYALGFPDARISSFSATEANGVDDLSQYHDASVITIDGNMLSQSRAVIYDVLRGMCLPKKRCYMYIKRAEWLVWRRAKLRANPMTFQGDQSTGAYYHVGMSWSNPAGEWEAADLTTVKFTDSGTGASTPTDGGISGTFYGYGTLLYGGGTYGDRPAPVGLMEAPTFSKLFGVDIDGDGIDDSAPSSYGFGRGAYGSLEYGSDAGDSGTDTGTGGNNYLYVTGNVDVLPKITVGGGFSDLLLNFNSVGTSVYLRGLTVAAADTLVIDSATCTILINGDIDKSVVSKLSISQADGWNGWPYLTNGQNDVDILTSAKGTDFYVQFDYRDGWV